MARQALEKKVESLERRVTTLEELPGRMDRLALQVLQLRAEMHDEFSAVRAEISDGDVMVVTALTEQIEESRRHARVLFEDAIGRIAVIGEGLGALSQRVDSVEASLSQRVDGVEASLSQRFDRVERALSEKIDRTDAKVDLILARLEPRVARRKTSRDPKKD